LRANSRARACGLLLGGWLALAASTALSAHRLDEYLQAARIDLRPASVSIDLDLTPGAVVAESVIAAIDRDGNGRLSIDEENAYAREIVRQLELRLDGAPLEPQLRSSAFPAIDALRLGEAAIRLRVSASHHTLASGEHQLFFANGHLTRQSVYLANALVPATALVAVTTQHRSADQRELTIDYAVGTAARTGVTSSGLLVGLVAAVLIVRYTRRQGN